MVKVVSRVKNSQQITIKKIAAETARIIAQENAKIISLAQGTPNLPIFQAAADAMTDLINTKKLPYTDVNGVLKVRQTCADFINKIYNPSSFATPCLYAAPNVIVTAGAVQSVYNVMALSIEASTDVVISPLPAYGLYKHQTEILGGTFYPIPTLYDNNFVPSIKDLRDAFEKHTVIDGDKKTCNIRSVVLCFPNNPVGSWLTEQQAKDLATFLDEMLEAFPNPGFSIVLDEVYLGILGSNSLSQYKSILMYASKRVLESSFLILSASKGLGAMPGMRAGFCAFLNQELVDHMLKIQTACSANASIVSQEGLRASLSYVMNNPEVIADVASHYKKRTDFAVKRLNEIGAKYLDGAIIAKTPEATFYVFASFKKLKQADTDEQIQQYFRDMYKNGSKKIGVACVPGIAFGMNPQDKFIRFACAVEIEDLQQAMDIIEEAVQNIVNGSIKA